MIIINNPAAAAAAAAADHHHRASIISDQAKLDDRASPFCSYSEVFPIYEYTCVYVQVTCTHTCPIHVYMYVFTGVFNPSTLGASTVDYMFFRNVKKIAPNFKFFFKEQFFFVCQGNTRIFWEYSCTFYFLT